MNYLLHFHAADGAFRSPLSAVGAMLPDFWRMSHRRARMRPSDSPVAAFDAELELGVRHHLAADDWFHSWPDFHDALAETTRLLKREQVLSSKSRLLGHVLWELALDGALVRRVGATDLGDRLRSALHACPPQQIEHTTRRLAFERIPSPEEKSRTLRRLGQLMSRLLAPNTIAELADADGLMQRMRGVRRRLRLPDLGADEQDGVRRVSAELLELAADHLQDLLRVDWSSLLVDSPAVPPAG